MENRCRHNSFRQVSKIIPRSLQTPAALKEKQYKRFFKHKIFKHSPGVASTSDTGSEPPAPCTGWLHSPSLCSNLRLSHSRWISRCPIKAIQTERLGLQTQRQENKKNILRPEWDFPKLLINKVNKGLCNLLITKMEQPSSHSSSPRRHWLLTLFTANHIKAPLPAPQRINSSSPSWPL